MIACSRSRQLAPITATLIYVDQPVRNRFHGVMLPGLLYVAVLIASRSCTSRRSGRPGGAGRV
jgi:hypothetical protein